jgi:hypothetical protein
VHDHEGTLQGSNNDCLKHKPDLASAVPFPVRLVTFLIKMIYILINQLVMNHKNRFTCSLIDEYQFEQRTTGKITITDEAKTRAMHQVKKPTWCTAKI